MVKLFLIAIPLSAMCVALVPQPAAAESQIGTSASGTSLAAVPSSYLAGYQITEPGISRASVTFIVPTMTCPTSDTQGTAEGIGNEATPGSPTLLGIVFTACVSGAPNLTIQAQAGGNINFGTASAGDRVNILITQTRAKVTATVSDVTSGTKVRASGTPTPDTSLVFGSFPLFSGTMLPVADFGSVRMLKPTLENTDLQDWSPTMLVRKDGSTTQILTRSFRASGAFSLVFRHN